MEITINANGVWYHGSNRLFAQLHTGSTVTQWRALAEAFSHKPGWLGYDDDGVITHNGIEEGFLYIIDEPVSVGKDVVPHPRTVMDPNAEFVTSRPLRVKLICQLPLAASSDLEPCSFSEA